MVMIKSGILALRAISGCQIHACLSLRPYTREQRLIKMIKKQEERLKRNNLRRQDYPIVLQPPISAKTIASSTPTASSSVPFASCEPTESSKAQLLDQDTLKRIYNLSEKDSPIALNICCAGCGANLHCGTPGTHGFLSKPEIIKLKCGEQPSRSRGNSSLSPVVCVRCQLIAQQDTALNESLPSEPYERQVIAELNNQENTIILLIADMTNLPHSIVPLRLNNPSAHKIVLIGNKVDQLPIDGPKFHSRWCEVLLNAFKEICGLQEDCVDHVALVSALNGYGIEKLLDFLLSKKFNVFGMC